MADGERRMEYEYKHSILKIIGTIGMAFCVICSGIVTIFIDEDIGIGIALFSMVFALLIMVGLLNEM